MRHGQDEKRRQDPFGDMGNEPVEELGLVRTPTVLAKRPAAGGRRTPVRPSEKRRRGRRVGVTFGDGSVPGRLRELAKRWGLVAPDGRSANVSALVEYLLVPQLEAAEAGEVEAPGEAPGEG